MNRNPDWQQIFMIGLILGAFFIGMLSRNGRFTGIPLLFHLLTNSLTGEANERPYSLN